MALIDSTGILGASIEQKARTQKNYDRTNNYWLRGIQDKIDAEWEYRSNRIEIEEELHTQVAYTAEPPKFTPLEVVIQEVVSDKGKKLSRDWRRIVTRDCNYDNFIGKRFRFSEELIGFQSLSEEEKKWKSSVWLGVNQSDPTSTQGLVIRRFNTTVAFAGTLTGKLSDSPEDAIVEYHYEPIILENDLKYINTYYNQTLNVAQAEMYGILQYNYFTQFLNVEDRLLFGRGNPVTPEKNNAYRIKSVEKFTSRNTYDFDNPNLELEGVPCVVIGLDKCPLEDGDNFEIGTFGFRAAERAPVYKVDAPYYPPQGEFAIVIEEPYETLINAQDEVTYHAYIYEGEAKRTGEGYTLLVSSKLEGTTKPGRYYDLSTTDNNTFKVQCFFGYVKSNLVITLQWKEKPEIKKEFEVELRSW